MFDLMLFTKSNDGRVIFISLRSNYRLLTQSKCSEEHDQITQLPCFFKMTYLFFKSNDL